MEDTSSTNQVTSQTTLFHEVLRALLRCLGLETGFHPNPISCPKEEDDHNGHASKKEAGSPPSPSPTTGYSDQPADPPSTTETVSQWSSSDCSLHS
ncbi:uncharacterized protein LOC120177889 isoform X2 [Hibiscus syriacus]|uniref:uncharacterized protein LOC120177889 isoform X2 n=1 Tax=Hibiscus syriacus TaxID=106335 RepID=UPI0019227739|nr:uncharacterized protein LOC120177889 isoform X2 [Hibiscus syriacus]